MNNCLFVLPVFVAVLCRASSASTTDLDQSISEALAPNFSSGACHQAGMPSLSEPFHPLEIAFLPPTQDAEEPPVFLDGDQLLRIHRWGPAASVLSPEVVGSTASVGAC